MAPLLSFLALNRSTKAGQSIGPVPESPACSSPANAWLEMFRKALPSLAHGVQRTSQGKAVVHQYALDIQQQGLGPGVHPFPPSAERCLQASLVNPAATGGDHGRNLPIIRCEDAIGAAIRAAAHLGFLIGPILQLGCALVNPAIWMECLNQKHGIDPFVWHAYS